MMNGFRTILATTVFVSGYVTPALAEDYDPFFEIIVMGGISNVDIGDSDFIIDDDETDKLVQNHDSDWDSWTGRVGVGYVYPLTDEFETDEVAWFPFISPQINVYYLNDSSIDGDVWQFEDPDDNDEQYTMNFNSTRVMFDLALTLVSLEHFAIYTLAGAGISFNEIDLDSPVEELNLDNDDSSFAYEFGVGFTYGATDRIALSLEYLYAGISDIELNDTDTNMVINTQSLLVGLRFAI